MPRQSAAQDAGGSAAAAEGWGSLPAGFTLDADGVTALAVFLSNPMRKAVILFSCMRRAGACPVRATPRTCGFQSGGGFVPADDLTIIDLSAPALRPLIRLVSNVVHYGHPGTVHSVMADGEFLMRDRTVLTIDEPALIREAEVVTRRVWERMIDANPDIAPPPGELRWLG